MSMGPFYASSSHLEARVLEKDAYGFYDKYESIAEAPLEFADKIYIESEL